MDLGRPLATVTPGMLAQGLRRIRRPASTTRPPTVPTAVPTITAGKPSSITANQAVGG